jgi:hypothetical protein
MLSNEALDERGLANTSLAADDCHLTLSGRGSGEQSG